MLIGHILFFSEKLASCTRVHIVTELVVSRTQFDSLRTDTAKSMSCDLTFGLICGR